MLKASGVKNVSIFLLGSLILQNAVAGKHRIIAVISTDYMGLGQTGKVWSAPAWVIFCLCSGGSKQKIGLSGAQSIGETSSLCHT